MSFTVTPIEQLNPSSWWDDGIRAVAISCLPPVRNCHQAWSDCDVGRQIVIEKAGIGRSADFAEDDDGLARAIVKRLKVKREPAGHDDAMEYAVPVIQSTTNARKTTERAWGRFAFADEPGAEDHLRQQLRLERAEEAMRQLFVSYRKGELAERARARRQADADRREAYLKEKAEAAGIAVDELKHAISLWDAARRHAFRPNNCLLCGRRLSDPVSISTGIGPECRRHMPAIVAAAKVHAIEIGKQRHTADGLMKRFVRAGLEELVKVIEPADGQSPPLPSGNAAGPSGGET